MSNDELREALAAAAGELMSRRNATGGPSSTQHLYRIRMTRTPRAEPQAYRFTVIEDTVVQLPLPLDQLVGKTGRVIGGEFLLNDGDVVRKVAATGMVSYLIPWQGNIDDRDYDVLGGHLKTGQWWSPQNRPTELTQDKVVIACRRVLRQ
jgi:hypothetical protein